MISNPSYAVLDADVSIVSKEETCECCGVNQTRFFVEGSPKCSLCFFKSEDGERLKAGDVWKGFISKVELTRALGGKNSFSRDANGDFDDKGEADLVLGSLAMTTQMHHRLRRRRGQ